VGWLCLLGALGFGAYYAWLFYGTTLTTNRAQSDLRESFEPGTAAPPVREEPGEPVKLPGRAVAILEIPKIELDMVVVEGTDTDALKKGPGHYEQTAYPWEDTGRVGIAGHRTTYGAPFWDLQELGEGDLITLVTEYGTFRYRVTDTTVIVPSEGWVLNQTKRPTLVLTTCEPRFSAAQRLIVFADRVSPPAAERAADAA
jgi:sortase A